MLTMESGTRVVVAILFACFQNSVAKDEKEAMMLARIEMLENEGQDYRALIAKQMAAFEDLKLVVETQNKRLKEQEQLIKMLLEWKQDSLHETPQQQQDVRPQQSKLGKNRSNNKRNKVIGRKATGLKTALSTNGGRHSRIVLPSGSPVAFHTTITNNSVLFNLAHWQKVLFDDVKLNIGNGYHERHGVFIAPSPGIYIFSLTVMSYTSNKDFMELDLLKNGEVLGGVYGHRETSDNRPWDQGSISIVTQLKVGDEVWVGHVEGAVWGSRFSSFMGCLLFPMY